MRILTSNEISAVNGASFGVVVANAFLGCLTGVAASMIIGDIPKINIILGTTVLFATVYGLTADH